MPKDEFDFEDPLELNGMAMVTEEDTTDAMCECFIEEFLRMNYNGKQILALFRNPNYTGMHMALEKRGEPFIRELINEVFARWGRQTGWTVHCTSRREEALTFHSTTGEQKSEPPHVGSYNPVVSYDPMGAEIPQINQ